MIIKLRTTRLIAVLFWIALMMVIIQLCFMGHDLKKQAETGQKCMEKHRKINIKHNGWHEWELVAEICKRG